MKRLSIFLTILFLLISNIVYSQVSRQWYAIYGGNTYTQNDLERHLQICRDAQNNIYVAGPIDTNIVIIKYNSQGIQQWASIYAANVWSVATSLALDQSGSLYVSGFLMGLNNSYPSYALFLKYDNNGNRLWAERLDSNTGFVKMIIDNSNNIYITGNANTNLSNNIALTMAKFNVNGAIQWQLSYVYPGATSNSPNDMLLDNVGNIYVCGGTNGINNTDYAELLKFNSNGNLIWNVAFNDSCGSYNKMCLDKNNNIYVTGYTTDCGITSYHGILFAKYNTYGEMQWHRYYTIPNANNFANDIKVDNLNNVYIAGSFGDWNNHSNSLLLKYNSNGYLQWIRMDGTNHSEDFSVINIDKHNNIYASGSNDAYYIYNRVKTSKYNSNGYLKWTVYDDTVNAPWSYPVAAIQDDQDNIYLTTTNQHTIYHDGILTVKYTQQYYSVSGQVTYRDNGQPVDSGYVKALYYDYSTASIVTVDSTRILTGGIYTLQHVPQDSCDIMFYQNDEDLDFVPTYYVSTLDWQQATRIYPTQNLTNINGQVYRINGAANPYNISGMATSNSDQGQAPISDAIIYAMVGNVYKNFGITGSNGTYAADKLAPGSYVLTACRMGFNPVSQNVTITSGNVQNINFNFGSPIGIQPISSQIPSKFNLYQNYPNPFNPETNIKFDVPKDQRVKIVIYDLTGREVNKLLDEEVKAGTYNVRWNGSNYASGVYFYRIETETNTLTKKMLLVK